MMEVISTEQYFNLPKEILSQHKYDGYFKEDLMILDDGLVVKFYKELEDLKQSISYWLGLYRHLEVKAILELTKENDNNYALILN